jgi:pyruvate/2-oxoacid:ferredoxin oxidoreductase beta subunit
MILVVITPESSIGNVVAIVGGLWMAAIGGQAVSDALKKKNNGIIYNNK